MSDVLAHTSNFATARSVFSKELTRVQQSAGKVFSKRSWNKITPWDRIKIARNQDRPNTLDYINMLADDFTPLCGDRSFADDKSIIGGLATICGRTFMVIGHQKGHSTKERITHNFGMAHPEGYRKALRLMKLAEKFNKPLLTFIDTPGAYPGIGAEERGQGVALAQNLLEMSQVKVPIVVTVIGEGGSGGALAIGIGDSIMMMENAYYSVITPEACSTILFKDASRAEESANSLKLTAFDLRELGIIDYIVPEPEGGAHLDHALAAAYLKDAILLNLSQIETQNLGPESLVKSRYAKFRAMGNFFT